MARYIVTEHYPSYTKHIREMWQDENPKPSGISGGATSLCKEKMLTCWDTDLPLPKEDGGWWFEQEHWWTRPCQSCARIYMEIAYGAKHEHES